MEEKRWCVYKHTCYENQKSYIGITSQKPQVRWGKNGSAYLSKASNKHWKNAIRKYGWEGFSHEIIEENLTKEEACEKEKYYINKYDSYNNGYNDTLGGEGGGMIGKHHSEQAKEKLSNYFKGRFVGELNYMYGKHTNNRGKLSEEAKQRISQKAKMRMLNDENYLKRLRLFNESRKKAVNQYDLEGNLVHTYDSAASAEKETGIFQENIRNVCARRKNKTGICRLAGGYQWRFSNDCDDIQKYIPTKPKTYHGGDNVNAIKINQYNINGEYIKTWDSISEAAKKYVVSVKSISNALNENKHTNIRNFQWRRYNEYSECKNIEPWIRTKDFSYCMKKVRQYDADGNLIDTYDSVTNASRATGINISGISNCCRGILKTSGGFIFEFEDVEMEEK